VEHGIIEEEKKHISYNRAEALIYSLNNSYLTLSQKTEVEMWYQLPGYVMIWIFIIMAITSVYIPLTWFVIVGVSLTVNFLVGIINWYFYNKKLIFFLYLSVLHRFVIYLICFSTAGFLIYHGALVLAIVPLLAPFGLLSIVEPHIYIYSFIGQKQRLHPKYLFFKKRYGMTFSFEHAEKLAERHLSSARAAEAIARGIRESKD
jgi:hypothetical protein